MPTPRNDASLYTGMTSTSTAKRKEKIDEKIDEKKERQRVIDPLSKILDEEFAREIATIGDLSKLNLRAMSAEDVKVEMLAREIANTAMRDIHHRIKNTLRPPKRPVKKEAEVEEGFPNA